MAWLPELEGERSSQEDSILPGLDREDGAYIVRKKGRQEVNRMDFLTKEDWERIKNRELTEEEEKEVRKLMESLIRQSEEARIRRKKEKEQASEAPKQGIGSAGSEKEKNTIHGERGKGPVMDIQEQKQFQEWLKTLCPWDKEWALSMAGEGKPLEEIRYYVEF